MPVSSLEIWHFRAVHRVSRGDSTAFQCHSQSSGFAASCRQDILCLSEQCRKDVSPSHSYEEGAAIKETVDFWLSPRVLLHGLFVFHRLYPSVFSHKLTGTVLTTNTSR